MVLTQSWMISDSVGEGGENRPDDVEIIRRLLNEHRPPGQPPLPVYAGADPFLIDRIRHFQYHQVGLLNPDGRVDPRGRTLRRLNELREPQWMAIARREMGVEEIPGDRHNPRVVQYLNTLTNISQAYRDRDETAWCSGFVNWCLIAAGYTGTNHGLATSWRNWGYALDVGQPGAITVVRKRNATSDASTGSTTGNHVAFFVEGNSRSIRLLGGNQGGGRRVQESTYSLSRYRLIAYRWPTPPVCLPD